ncbi:unnamed protein product [Alopecurus aequalis]
MKMPEPAVLPHFKPADYVDVLARIHEELECCPPDDRSCLYLLQFQVFRGLGEAKLARRSLQAAWEKAATIHDKLVFGAWLRYDKRGERPMSDLLASCGKCSQEFSLLDFVSQQDSLSCGPSGGSNDDDDEFQGSPVVHLQIRDDMIACDRRKLARLSTPLYAMLNGGFKESYLEVIDMSRNGISPVGMRAISKFSLSGRLPYLSPEAILEILDFANKFCCKGLKDACERKLASFVSSRQDAMDFMECAIELGCSVLAASCLQVLLNELPECLNDEQVVRIFSSANKQQRSTMAGDASFSLYCLLSEVSMSISATSDVTISFLEKLVDSASDSRQRQLALHQLACMRLLRKDHAEAERLFNAAFTAGHLYSVVGLARLASLRSNRHFSLKLLDSVMSSRWPLGWMYQERALYLDGDSKLENLNKATELDPTLTYPYMVRAASLMKRQSVEAALMEINRILGFKLVLECLELRFCCYLALEDYRAALCDVQAILTLAPDYRMIAGRVAAKQLRMLVMENVEQWTTADCWMQLYDRWSSVDDIGSLSVIYQMLESDAAKGVLYFRQSLLLLRLNCPEAAMRSLQLAREHAASQHERLVYEGWILYDTGHCEEGLQKAEASIVIQRSFEAFFLKAYALADSSLEPSTSATVVSLLEDALRCPSDRLRKGQIWHIVGFEQPWECLCGLWEARARSRVLHQRPKDWAHESSPRSRQGPFPSE